MTETAQLAGSALSGSRGRREDRGDTVEERALTGLLLAAAAALGLGVAARQADPSVGFSFAGAVVALSAQLPTTGPALLAVSIAMAAELGAGTVVMRGLRGAPFRSWSDALVEGYAGAIVLDAFLLFALGGESLFTWQAVGAAICGVLFAGTRLRPLVLHRPRPRAASLGRWPLVALVWLGPLALALASPVVPFGDVLPNHVAPAEHLRIFGGISTLATNPSPVYGPSRLFLGYISLLGGLSTLTGLPATLAVAVFAVPLALISALAVRRLAAALFGRAAGFWALLAFPLSFTFVRLTDSRDSVAALPVAACALTLLATHLAGGPRAAGRAGRPDRALAAMLTAAALVHPLVGALLAATVAALTLTDSSRFGRRVFPALAGLLIACLPQVAVMVGLSPPPWTGLFALGGGLAVVELSARLAVGTRWPGLPIRPIPIAGLVLVAVGAAVAVALADPTLLPIALGWLRLGFPLLFAGAICGLVGLVPAGRGGRRQLGACLGVGLGALAVVALVPASTLQAASLRYEVPKAIGYWLPWACVPVTAGALAALWRWRRPLVVRLALIGSFLVLALLPIGTPVPNIEQASHPAADTLAYDLRTAELGYWQGYPDPRLLLDPAGRELVSFLRGDVADGRLQGADGVLHVAKSYQAWASVPVAVFTGVLETLICADAAPTIYTLDSRLLPLADLAAELRAGYRYLLLEPAGLPSSIRTAIVGAGYRSVFGNARGEIFTAPAP